MPNPTSAAPSGMAALIPMIVVIVLLIAIVVLVMQAPGVRDFLSRFLGGHTDQDDLALVDDEAQLDPPLSAVDGAVPFPGFDPAIYGPAPDPDAADTVDSL